MKTLSHVSRFFILTYAFSWTLWIIAALTGQHYTEFPAIVLFTLGGFGPSVVGIWLAYRWPDRGAPRSEARDLWRRLIDARRISVRWYAAILALFPLTFGLAYGINALAGGAEPAMEGLNQIRAQPLMLVATLVIGLVGGPLSEELGWRGYALDRMQARWSVWKANLLLSIIWWAWHLPLFFIKGTTQYRIGMGTVEFWLFLANIVPLTFQMAAAYNANRRSVLSAVLLHLLFNFTMGLFFPVPVSFNAILVLLTAVAAIVLLRWAAKPC